MKGLSAGATYYFKVAAVSAQGTGPASGVASVMLPPQKPVLGAPGNVIAQPGRSRVIVMWTTPATAARLPRLRGDQSGRRVEHAGQPGPDP